MVGPRADKRVAPMAQFSIFNFQFGWFVREEFHDIAHLDPGMVQAVCEPIVRAVELIVIHSSLQQGFATEHHIGCFTFYHTYRGAGCVEDHDVEALFQVLPTEFFLYGDQLF